MNINEYLKRDYNLLKSKITAITRGHQNSEDLLNDCLLSLMEKGPDFIHQLINDDKIENYIVRSAYIQYNSSTSQFYTRYKKQKFSNVELENLDIEDKKELHEDKEKLGNDIKIYISNLPHYERTLAEQHFIKGNSQREMSKMYNINRIHISKDIGNIKKNLHLSFSREEYKTK